MYKVSFLLLFSTSLLLLVITNSCDLFSEDTASITLHLKATQYEATLNDLTEAERIAMFSKDEQYQSEPYTSIELLPQDNSLFTLQLIPANESVDTIYIKDVDLTKWTPFIPEWLREDRYLSAICIVQQSTTNHQVEFDKNLLGFSGKNPLPQKIDHLILQHHCFAPDSWELLAFSGKGANRSLLFGSEFTFPKSLFQELFQAKNQLPKDRMEEIMQEVSSINNKPVILSLLRSEGKAHGMPYVEQEINALADSSLLHPLLSEIQCQKFEVAEEQYELPRLRRYIYKEIETEDAKHAIEIELSYKTVAAGILPHLYMGGFGLSEIPFFNKSQNPTGLLIPFGWQATPSIESYQKLTDRPPHYAFLLNHDKKWLSPYQFNIDACLLYFESEKKEYLHIWLLNQNEAKVVKHYRVHFGC